MGIGAAAAIGTASLIVQQPASGTVLAAQFLGRSDQFGVQIAAASDSTKYAFKVLESTGSTALFTVWGDGGIVVGNSPTGGNKGAGTINATAVYDDNVLLTDWVYEAAYENKLPTGKQLYSLSETQKYTEQEHRLPWMPSIKEFEQRRGTGAMITSLWQGQEQQQLYLFELEQRIKQLENKDHK